MIMIFKSVLISHFSKVDVVGEIYENINEIKYEYKIFLVLDIRIVILKQQNAFLKY